MLIDCLPMRVVVAGLLAAGAGMGWGQNYPARPLRVIASAPGASGDMIARVLARELTGLLGQQVIVDNRGIVAVETVARAQPDGYTLLFYGDPMWLSPFFRKASWDPVKDFAPIAPAGRAPNVLVVHPLLPVKTVRELIALAKAKPGELNYGSGAPGGVPHLAAELFKSMAHVDIVRISYKGTGLAGSALLGGEVQLMFLGATSVLAHIKSGRLRALGVASTARSPWMPDLPTVAEAGLPGFEASAHFAIFAPAKTPPALIGRLNRDVVRALQKNEVKERLFNAGIESIPGSPDDLAAIVKSEMAKWGKLIKDAGLRD